MEQPIRTNSFQAANEIMAAALGLPVDQRNNFVEARCAGDPALQQSVLRLLDRFDRLGDFLEEPAYSPPEQLQSGDLLEGRFRIVRKIGSGGMGVVYEAEDRVLHETIALKLIGPEFRENEEVDARFRDEIRLARKIAHPNVCRTFDVFSSSRGSLPFLFFTMEMLEGETLAAKIQAHGALLPAAALDIAAQIAAGLDAAHSQGIIHRDLKPANIMLVPVPGGASRAVITDFGLARPLDSGPAAGITQTGQLLGSPLYMAPEQFLGIAITAAADIYTLGLMLVEMVSGKRPFPDESIVRTAIRRTTEDSLLLVDSGVPAAWIRPLSRALSRDPAMRYASAGALILELEKSDGGVRYPSRRSILYSAAAVCTVSASAVILRSYKWKAARLPAVPKLMFANASSPGPESQTAAAFMTLLRRQMDPAHVGVLPDDQVRQAWTRMQTNGAVFPVELKPREAREVALRAGANLVVFTGATRKLDDWSFWIRLELLGASPAAAVSYWEREFKAALSGDRFSASTNAANWLRDTVGASVPANSRERTPQELTTSNWEALEEYTQANEAWIRGDRDQAVRHLKTALDLDPDFPLAANRMADILTTDGRTDEGLTYYARAAELSRSRNLTDRESLRMRTLFALDTGQSNAAEESAARWASEYPEDYEPLVHQATALVRLGQWDAALHILDLAVQRSPDSRSPWAIRSMTFLRLGRFDESARDCDRLAKIASVDFTWQIRGALAFARLDMPAAWGALEQLSKANSASLQSMAYGLQACHRAEQGRREEGARILLEGVRFDHEHSLAAAAQKKRRLLAQLYILDRRFREAREQCGLALAGHLGHASDMEIGCVLAQAGDLAGAEGCLRSGLTDWPVYSYWHARLEGEIALGSGSAPRAFSKMVSAPEAGRGTFEWPSYLVRAAYVNGQRKLVMESLSALLANPARYWFNADFNGPGFLRWALDTFDSFIDRNLRPRASAIRQALGDSN